MLTVTHADGPAFNTRSWTKQDSTATTLTPQPDITPDVSPDTNPTPKFLMADRLEALLQMQKTDPFCKCISKHLLNGKALQHETYIFTHVKGLLYKHGNGFWTEVPCSCDPKVLEINSSGGSSRQVRTLRELLHILSNKMAILLEGYKQGYLEIYHKSHTLLQGEGQNSALPFTNDGNTR